MVQENIKNKPKGFGTVAPAFLEGGGGQNLHWKNQWISVEEDLPCNHKELLNA